MEEYLRLGSDYQDPDRLDLEIVERKGLGHPDTLADALAELISMEYSKHCLDKFGVVLHHNIDKLYIGAGLFLSDYGYCRKIKPVQVFVNGRMSNSFAGERIDLFSIQEKTILNYLESVLPRLSASDIIVNQNSTQNSRIPHWFSPRNADDLPEYSSLTAGDSAACVFSWPPSKLENLVFLIEEYFWDKNGLYPKPKFGNIGQDIKVMAYRRGRQVHVGVRLPVICTSVSGKEEYQSVVDAIQRELTMYANSIAGDELDIFLEVNSRKSYLLGIGSCIECGEEGLVGRGNSNLGVISTFRPHSVEAPSGKNPVYHTGRVLNYLVKRLSKAIYTDLKTKNTVLAIANNGGSLVPPALLSISAQDQIPKDDLIRVVKKHFLDVDYVKYILSERQII